MSAEIKKINSDLQEIYKEFKEDLIKIVDKNHTGLDLNRFSAPLLMNINDQYLDACPKVLLVGQETCGWGDDISLLKFLKDDEDRIKELINKYDKFNFACKDRHNTPFWRFYRELHKKLKIDFKGLHPNSIAWTNLFKFDYNGKALSNEQKGIFKSINGEILKREIEIIKPDIILFVTGFGYDNFIKEFFPNQVYEKIVTGFLARIRHESLPANTFRTFHPKSLQLRKKFDYVFDLINANIQNSPEFAAKMKRGEEDIKAGRTTKIEPADIWNVEKTIDETDRKLANPTMVKRLKESEQQIREGKGVKMSLDDI